MDSEFIKAEAIQKIIDRINLKTPLVKDIKVVYRKEIDYYVSYVSINRDDLLKEYKILYDTAPNGYWKDKYEWIMVNYLFEKEDSYADIDYFLDVEETVELADSIRRVFVWNGIPESHIIVKVKLLV
jgi:hypothetical protein